MALVVENVEVSRSGRPVLGGVSFTLAPGEALVLRGPNGVGKTTLLRAIAGLMPLDRGRIDHDEAAGLAWAGYLDGLKPQLTIAENLRFWAALEGGGSIAAALDAFGLADIADRAIHACSAGQKRRAGLARLLLARRALWLLDEPTVALDAEAIALLVGILDRHCAGGGIAVIATHAPLDLAAARDLRLAPPAPGTAAAAGNDPFLAGSWG